MSDSKFSVDVAIVGGCGHVGLPLGLVIADRGLDVTLFDVNATAVDQINAGCLPFDEPGAAPVLERVLAAGRLRATTDASSLRAAEHVVIAIGTPIDSQQKPDVDALPRAIADIAEHLVDGQLLVLRGTVYPGATAMVEQIVARLGRAVDVAFCPERTAESRAMTELSELPQIIGARREPALGRAAKLLGIFTHDLVYLEPEEAELAKLFTNTWRYLKFAAANQLYMMANDCGLDYERIRSAVTYNYPRAADLPAAGFAGGPCLPKDTFLLTAFSNDTFSMGQASVMTNQGLPAYLVARLEQQYELATMTVGILGMSFKAQSDDVRSSLSYELKRILASKAKATLTHDPYVSVDPELVAIDQILRESDLLIIGAPHAMYRDLDTDLPVIDLSNLREGGVRI